MSPHELTRLVERRGGVVRGSALRGAGASRRDLAAAVRSGELVRVRDGVYASPRAELDVLAAAAHGGAIACASVLRRAGVWVLDDAALLHVWLGPNGRAHPHDLCGCVSHRDGGTTAFGVVPIARALVQVARCLGAECFFAAFESAWHLGRLSAADRAEVRRRLPARQRWLVDFARGDAESGLESLLRLRLHRHGIALESQVPIAGVGRVDFVLAGRLILEADGKGNHDDASHRHEDLVRDAVAAALGYETLRFDYALIVHDWPCVERAILARIAVIHARRG